MKRLGCLLLTAGLGLLVHGGDAAACGGCFAPPATVQVVTDHRMVLSLSSTQTVLWDQFQYAGVPSEFSWILPIHYSTAVHVQVASNGFMQLADDVTAPQVIVPSRPFSGCFNGAVEAPGVASSDASATADASVIVDVQEVVGPYDVAIISGTDPMAIRTWLTTHGYVVPASVSPVIDYYTSLSMDYVALRLRPTEGINQMTPIRVVMPGYVPSLPLRMIAAGVADKVGLSLMVLAPSRIEVQNFPNGVITPDDLTYDFNQPTSPPTDFLNAFEALNTAQGGRLWLTESATPQYGSTWLSLAGSYRYLGPPATDGGPPSDPSDDIRTAFGAIGTSATVTRLRADLGAAALDRDLLLQASDLGTQGTQYTYGHVLNTPMPTPCPGADAGTSAVDGGVAPTGALSTGGVHCTAMPWAASGGRNRGVGLGLLALCSVSLARRARRRSPR